MRNFFLRLAEGILSFLTWLIFVNNGRCVLLWIITGLLLWHSIATGLGEPILNNFAERIGADAGITNTQVDMIYKIHRNLPLDQPLPTPQTKPSLWWSWRWWLATLAFFLISAIYTPVALREEIVEAGQRAWESIREREETEARTAPPTPPSGEAPTTPPTPPPTRSRFRDSFSRLFSIDLLAEFAWDIIRHLPARFLVRRA
jgi:hypothetical protein